jgi:hypothetical protein
MPNFQGRRDSAAGQLQPLRTNSNISGRGALAGLQRMNSLASQAKK